MGLMGCCLSVKIKAHETSLQLASSVSSLVQSARLKVTRTEGEILQSSNLKSFSYNDLRIATRNFRPDSVLGEGGFGCVYKGWIDEHSLAPAKAGSGMVIAVKRLKQEGFQGHKEWLTEINYLGQLLHPNLVNLIGYCLEDEHRLLIYEFMPCGSLENHLFRRSSNFEPLSWNLRMKVALGAAKGLAFLHSPTVKVIYRDFKPSNILLDSVSQAPVEATGLPQRTLFVVLAEKTDNGSPRVIGTKQGTILAEVGSGEPNRLSEELLQCLIRIFLKMKQRPSEDGGATSNSWNTPNCISSRGISSKTTFSCKARSHCSIDDITANSYDVPDSDRKTMNVGTYKSLIQITRSSMMTNQISDSYPVTRKLRVLQQKLCYVDLTSLSHKQKLAFWINICNACIMHAYLQHGLPSTQERMLTLLNKAALNVGGIVLNALAIEHYLLRHPVDSKHDPADEKEMLLRRAYGLRYPEPNVTFALCRGNWSSPALSVYTPDEVVNQLSRANIQYLEAFVKVTSKKKIMIPKLLQWYMHDFADDIESLIEWIYSQLPPKGTLKREILDCLKDDTKIPARKMIEIIPYDYEFRYLLTH